MGLACAHSHTLTPLPVCLSFLFFLCFTSTRGVGHIPISWWRWRAVTLCGNFLHAAQTTTHVQKCKGTRDFHQFSSSERFSRVKLFLEGQLSNKTSKLFHEPTKLFGKRCQQAVCCFWKGNIDRNSVDRVFDSFVLPTVTLSIVTALIFIPSGSLKVNCQLIRANSFMSERNYFGNTVNKLIVAIEREITMGTLWIEFLTVSCCQLYLC